MDLSNYDALGRGCGLLSREERGRLEVTGGDRRSLLQGLLTNDIEALAARGGMYAAWLTPQGRMIADLNVIDAGDAVLLDVPRELAPALLERLDRSIFAEDAAVRDVTSEWVQVALAGPAAGRAAGAVRGVDPFIVYRSEGIEAVVLDLYARQADADNVRKALLEAGAAPIGADAAEAFRIEAGIPRWGFDLDEETIPLEAGIERRAISFTKGCYVGQEVIVRVLHRGQGRVARRLVRLALPESSAERLPPRGEPLKKDDRGVGRLTSVAWSPSLAHGIALGYVHRDFVERGTELTTGTGRAVVR